MNRRRRRLMKDNKRKRYSEAFKRDAVIRAMGQNASAHSVSKELGLSQPTLSKWVKKFKQEGSSVVSQEDVELNKLRVRIERLQDERDILKKALSFFASHEG